MIHVHLTAHGDLRRYRPASERDNGTVLELQDDATIMQMLDALKLAYHNIWLIGVNDAIVGLDRALRDGDQIELMLPIGGGCSTH